MIFFWEVWSVGSKIGYVKYLIFHPFDGFYDLKHEKRGSLGTAMLIMSGLIIVSIMQRQLTGYIFNVNRLDKLNVISEILSILIPYVLFCVANWAVTTLLDGEGGIKDIFTYVAYSFAPAVILGAVFVVASNVMTLREIAFLRFINVISSLWVAFLMFVGTLTTHQYTIKKTILVFILILIAMGIMIFTFTLFFTLIDRFTSFVTTILQELDLRQ